MVRLGIVSETTQRRWARRYECCDSEPELLDALCEAISSSAQGLARTLEPRWYGGWTMKLLKRFWPESHAEHLAKHLRIMSESIVYVSRQVREHLASSGDADYVYQEAVLGAGGVSAARCQLGDGEAIEFHRILSHVLLQHAHFPPSDDDAALVRLVAAREQKLTVSQAVRFVTELVGTDPVGQAAPVAFVRRWVSLRGEAWGEAAGV